MSEGPTPADSPSPPVSGEPAEPPPVESAPASAEAPATTASPVGDKKPKKKRSWRRRIVVGLWVLVIGVILLRVALSVAFPSVLRRVAGAYGLECTYERLQLSLLGGDVGIWHLELRPKEGGDSLVHADYVRGNISPLALLTGRLEVWRVEADGARLIVEREADGSIPLLRRFSAPPPPADAPAAQAPAPGAPAAPPAPPRKLNLTSPFRVEALRVRSVKAKVRDRAVSPPVETDLDLNVRVSDLGSATRATTFEVDVSSPPLFDALRIEGEGRSAGKSLDAVVRVRVRGFHGRESAGYLSPLGVRTTAHNLAMDLTGRVQMSEKPGSPDALTGTAWLEGVAVTADGRETVALDKLILEADAINLAYAKFSKVTIDGARCRGERTAAGGLAVPGLELVPVAGAPVAAASTTLVTATPTSPQPSVAPSAVTQPAGVAAAQPAPAPAPTPAPAAPASLAGLPLRWSVGELVVRNVSAAFRDARVTPAADLRLEVPQLTAKNVISDPDQPDAPLNLDGVVRAPGVCETMHFKGTARPFSAAQAVDLAVQADGVRPDAVRAYLDAAGVESELQSGSLTCRLRAAVTRHAGGRLGADVRLDGVKFTDGSELFALDDANFTGVTLDPQSRRIKVESAEIVGPSLSARLEASGAMAGLGFRTRAGAGGASGIAAPPTASAASPTTEPAVVVAVAPATGPAPAGINLPGVEIGRLRWKGVRLKFEDRHQTPAAVFVLTDAGVEITDFRFDPSPDPSAGPANRPAGKIRAWVNAPDLAGSIVVDGTATARPDGTELDLEVSGDGLKGTAAASYLRTKGIEPVLRDGSLRLRAKVALAQRGEAVAASLSVDGLSLRDGGEELVGLDALRVSGVEARPGHLDVAAVELDRPRVHAVREADGSLVLAGFRKFPVTQPAQAPQPPQAAPTAPQAVVTVTTAPPTAPPATGPTEVVALTTAPSAVPTPATPTSVAALKKLSIRDASVRWTDRMTPSPVDTTAAVSLQLDGVVVGRPAEPATLSLSGGAAGAVDQFTVAGRVSPDAAAPAALLDVNATGVRVGPLAAYLPQGMRTTLTDGRFNARIDAGMSPHPAGGRSGRLVVTKLDYRDGPDAPPLARFDSARVLVSRFDPAGRAIAVEEVTLEGFEADVRKSPDGATHLLGLSLGAPATQPALAAGAAPEPRPATAPAIPAPAAPAPMPATPNVALAQTPPAQAPPAQAALPSAPATAAAQVSSSQAAAGQAMQMFAQQRKPLPLVTLGMLHVHVRRLSLRDLAGPGAAPVTVGDLYVWNREPVEMLGDDPASRPPARLEVYGRIDPLVESLAVSTVAAPFAAEPSVKVEFDASGIKGDGVAKAFSAAAAKLQGQNVTDGRLKAELEVEAKVSRRTQLDVDFSRPYELTLAQLRGLEFRGTRGGPVLAALEEIRVEKARVEPETGSVSVRLLEINKPSATLRRDAEGLHALGFVLKPVGATTQPAAPTASPAPAVKVAQAPSPVPSPSPAPTPAPARAPASAPPAGPQREIRVDKLVISGVDVKFEDRAVNPPMMVPITSLDLEARDLTSLMLTEERSARFSVLVSSGKVVLPRRQKGGGIGGAFGDVAAMLGGQKVQTKQEFEQREVFSQVAATGRLAVYPQPEGWLKASVNGLDLAALKGVAAEKGIVLEQGVFDSNVDVRLSGAGQMDVRSKFTFTDLNVADSPDGAIVRHLHLPAPLDAVLRVLENADGAINVPLSFPVKGEKVSADAVTGPAVAALGSIIVEALAGAPAKTVTDVAGLIGLDLKGKKKPDPPVVLAFAAGDTALDGGDVRALAPLVKRLREDKSLELTVRHELGGGDVPRAAARANPSPDECLALARELRLHKTELLSARAEAAGTARATLAAGGSGAAAHDLEQLRAINRDLAYTEDALDRVYEMFRPGAERQADRRTRAACVEIGQGRLNSVKAALMAAGVPGAEKRVRVTRPQFSPAGRAGGKVTVTVAAGKK